MTRDADDGSRDDSGGGDDTAAGSTDGRRADGLARRGWLQTIGVATLFGGLGGAGIESATAQPAGDANTADTSLSADERIQRHRTGDLAVVVTDPQGRPVEGAEVTVEQLAHDFGWGTAVNADTLLNQSSEGDDYRTTITDLFNTAVLENRHKWRFWEEQRDLADRATEWILDQGLDLRGHVCVWGDRGAYAVPADVETAIDDGDVQTIRERSMSHIETIIDHYGDDIAEWEVVNEAMHKTELIEAVDGSNVNPVEAPVLADWYQQAQEARPEGVDLAVNDYNTLSGPYEYARSDYETQIEFLQGEGVDLGSAGMQCHFSGDQTVGTQNVLEQLNEYAQYGLDLKITEFDMADDSWDEQAKAEFFEEFLRATFSHPAVTDFLLWGFWDGRHWQGDAPLFAQDWTPKPSHDVYTSLVFEEWWTDESGTTDAEGGYTTAAFLGEHEITVSTASGETTTTTASVTDADGMTTVTVTVDAEPGGTGSGSETGGAGTGSDAGSSGSGNAGSSGSGGDDGGESGTTGSAADDSGGAGWWGSSGTSDTDGGDSDGSGGSGSWWGSGGGSGGGSSSGSDSSGSSGGWW